MFYSACLALFLNLNTQDAMFPEDQAAFLIQCYTRNEKVPIDTQYNAMVLDTVENMNFEARTDTEVDELEDQLFILGSQLITLEID